LAFRCPFKGFVLLKQLRHRLGYLRKIPYKSSVITC
jgi:hypothetical protein